MPLEAWQSRARLSLCRSGAALFPAVLLVAGAMFLFAYAGESPAAATAGHAAGDLHGDGHSFLRLAAAHHHRHPHCPLALAATARDRAKRLQRFDAPNVVGNPVSGQDHLSDGTGIQEMGM